MRILILLIVAGALSAQAPSFEVVANVKDVMAAMTIPASDAVFNGGLKDQVTDKDWEEMRKQALVLAESANLLMMPGRARDNGNWMKASKQMLDAGKLALAAIKAKDLDKLNLDASDAILMSCSACHDLYMAK